MLVQPRLINPPLRKPANGGAAAVPSSNIDDGVALEANQEIINGDEYTEQGGQASHSLVVALIDAVAALRRANCRRGPG